MGSYLRNQNFRFCYFTSLQPLFLVPHLMHTMGISSPIHYTKPAGRMIMHCFSKFCLILCPRGVPNQDCFFVLKGPFQRLYFFIWIWADSE